MKIIKKHFGLIISSELLRFFIPKFGFAYSPEHGGHVSFFGKVKRWHKNPS